MENKLVVGRFAPSPSGRMHLGNLFSALLAWLAARHAGGRMLLRIEDLDPQRCRPEYTDQLICDLVWCGLDWDDGYGAEIPPANWRQSCRDKIYARHLAALRERGLVYPCFCTRGELHAAEAPHAADGTPIYSGKCRALTPREAAEKERERSAALRGRVPAETITFEDINCGRITENLARECGDFILRRSDGVYAYQLAVTVDDAMMGVTQVVRGCDLLHSTPRQIWLQRQWGYPQPEYAHIPLLCDQEGRRLSKREKDLDLGVFRQKYSSPEAIIGGLGWLAGLLEKPEPLSVRDLLPLFSWQKLRENPRAKWENGEWKIFVNGGRLPF